MQLTFGNRLVSVDSIDASHGEGILSVDATYMDTDERLTEEEEQAFIEGNYGALWEDWYSSAISDAHDALDMER